MLENDCFSGLLWKNTAKTSFPVKNWRHSLRNSRKLWMWQSEKMPFWVVHEKNSASIVIPSHFYLFFSAFFFTSIHENRMSPEEMTQTGLKVSFNEYSKVTKKWKKKYFQVSKVLRYCLISLGTTNLGTFLFDYTIDKLFLAGDFFLLSGDKSTPLFQNIREIVTSVIMLLATW